jgi:hypothetical protein
MPYEALNKARISRALRRLGELALAEKVTLEVSLYGGAVFTLVYGSRDSTRDVDALVQPSEIAKRLAAAVAREQGLPDDWLNDHVKQFLSHREEKRALTGVEFGPGLRLSVPTAAYLLALKLRACRPPLPGYAGDEADIRFLLSRLKPKSVAAVEELFERFFPGDGLSASALVLVKEALPKERP